MFFATGKETIVGNKYTHDDVAYMIDTTLSGMPMGKQRCKREGEGKQLKYTFRKTPDVTEERQKLRSLRKQNVCGNTRKKKKKLLPKNILLWHYCKQTRRDYIHIHRHKEKNKNA